MIQNLTSTSTTLEKSEGVSEIGKTKKIQTRRGKTLAKKIIGMYIH